MTRFPGLRDRSGLSVGGRAGSACGGTCTDKRCSVGREFDGTRTYLAPDHHGSITATTDTSSLYTRTRYTPYGTPRTGYTATTTNTDDDNFLAQPDDPATETIYLNNRHYLPSYGVFTNVDPLVWQTFQPYAYAATNPVALADPTGLEPCYYARERGQANACRDEYRSQQRVQGKIAIPDENLESVDPVYVLEHLQTEVFYCETNWTSCLHQILNPELIGRDFTDGRDASEYMATYLAYMYLKGLMREGLARHGPPGSNAIIATEYDGLLSDLAPTPPSEDLDVGDLLGTVATGAGIVATGCVVAAPFTGAATMPCAAVAGGASLGTAIGSVVADAIEGDVSPCSVVSVFIDYSMPGYSEDLGGSYGLEVIKSALGHFLDFEC